MASRQEAERAIARHLGIPDAPKRLILDGGQGRWLVSGTQALAVDAEGTVRAPSDVFTADELARLRQMFWG